MDTLDRSWDIFTTLEKVQTLLNSREDLVNKYKYHVSDDDPVWDVLKAYEKAIDCGIRKYIELQDNKQ